MRGVIKIAIVLLLVVAIIFIAQPLINKDTAPASNIENLENIDGIRNISAKTDGNDVTLKIIVENDLPENQARTKAEEVVNQIDVEGKKIVFSLLYEHGYLIGQGGLEVDDRDIQWD